jgi:glycosyltransferase involved in cell wall biosynthesis
MWGWARPMRIVVLNHNVPFPPIGGGRMRTSQLLEGLAEDHELVLVAFSEDPEPARPDYPIEVVGVPWDWPDDYRAMQTGDAEATHRLSTDPLRPWAVSIFETEAMAAAVERLAASADLVIVEHSEMGVLLPALPRDLPKLLDLQNVNSLVERRRLTKSNEPGAAGEAERMLAFERWVVSQCSAAAVCSEAEAEAARTLLGAERVEVVPNGVDTAYFTPSTAATDPGTVLFSGLMSYEPNVEAARFFALEVLPLVRRELPDTVFHVVGAEPTPEVEALASPHVVVHGRVDDMRPFFDRAEQVVVPILAGGGTRLKVLEAAASGKPIASTSLGMEGLAFRPSDEIVVADSAPELAAAVVGLARDPERRARLGKAARTRALEYEWDAIRGRFRQLVEAVAAAAPVP